MNTNKHPESIAISQHFANFFVNEARKNAHTFSNNALFQKLDIWSVPILNFKGDLFEHFLFFETDLVTGDIWKGDGNTKKNTIKK